MRRGGDVRDAFQQRHVFGMLAEFVIADQRAEGSAAEDAVLFFVDLLEQRALVELRARSQMSRSSSFLVALRTRIFSPTPVSLLSIRYFRPRQEPSSFWNAGWCMISFNWRESR